MERNIHIVKVTALAVAIVVAILCLGYSNAYGIAAPQMQLTKPGELTLPTITAGGISIDTPRDYGYDSGYDTGDYTDDGDIPPIDEKISPVPEPATFILLGVGLAGIKLLRKRH